MDIIWYRYCWRGNGPLGNVMAKWGEISTERKLSCTFNLQNIADDVIFSLPWTDEISGITIHDVAFLCGHRGKDAQNLAYMIETSLVQWPDGKHNTFPSKAMDLGVYHAERPHIHWKDKDEMESLKRLVFICAENRGVKLRSGLDWDGDGVRGDRDPDENLFDGVHFEEVDS